MKAAKQAREIAVAAGTGAAFDRKAYMREYMKTYLPKYRARRKGKK